MQAYVLESLGVSMSPVRQLELVTETDEEREAEAERQILLRLEFMAAARATVRELGGFDEAAKKLDRTWGRDDVGRGVSGSTFRAAVNDTERNYFRLEWIFELANHSETIKDLLRAAADGRSKKSAEDELRDVHDIIRRKYPEDAEAIIRKARTKGSRR